MRCEPQFPKVLLVARKGLSNKFVQSALEENDDEEDDRETLVEAPCEGSLSQEPLTVTEDPSKTPVVSRFVPTAGQGSGVSTFLEIDEHSELNPGEVTLEPCMNIGLLLDPLEEECALSAPSEDLDTADPMEDDYGLLDPIEEGPALPDPLANPVSHQEGVSSRSDHSSSADVVTLDKVLSLCQNDLHYTPGDLQAMNDIYCQIDEGGKAGVTMETIKSSIRGSSMPVDDIVQDLINFEQVLACFVFYKAFYY